MSNKSSNQGIILNDNSTINADQIAVGENAQAHKTTPSQSEPVNTEIVPIKILILAANPILDANPMDTEPLRLDEEIREIDEALRRAKRRDQFVLEQRLATRVRDLQRAMLDINPDIVHFSGHGLVNGLILESHEGRPQFVQGEALKELFELFENRIKCVILNACYSSRQAEAISQHIEYVIGMEQPIGDKAAIEFTIGFYDALCSGYSYTDAYKFGRNAIRLSSIPDQAIPILHTKVG